MLERRHQKPCGRGFSVWWCTGQKHTAAGHLHHGGPGPAVDHGLEGALKRIPELCLQPRWR